EITSINWKTINLFEAFSGIGAQNLALKNISKKMKWKINNVGIIEWFIDAIIAYESIHNPIKNIKKEDFNLNVSLSKDSKKPINLGSYNKILKNSEIAFWLNRSRNISKNLFDITKVNPLDLPKNIDIFTYSFPCQDLSGQGNGKGMKKSSNTRSGLLWEIDRILSGAKNIFNEKEMPKYLLLENVKAMINKNHKQQYLKWINRLNELGYESKEYILNSKYFNMPQARERVFVLSVLKTHKERVNFNFKEIKGKNKIIPIKSILEKNVEFDNKFNKFNLIGPINKIGNFKKYKMEDYSNFSSENVIFDSNYNGPTLTASGALSRIKILDDENKKIRTMTPKECFRYMGFKDHDFNSIQKTNLISPTKQIYLAGNSIVITVLEEIFRTLVF
ncbi:MAG: DNA (cytosine-5-)-methyltransferase, partial [Metamycoplasmataceae bacterium]